MSPSASPTLFYLLGPHAVSYSLNRLESHLLCARCCAGQWEYKNKRDNVVLPRHECWRVGGRHKSCVQVSMPWQWKAHIEVVRALGGVFTSNLGSNHDEEGLCERGDAWGRHSKEIVLERGGGVETMGGFGDRREWHVLIYFFLITLSFNKALWSSPKLPYFSWVVSVC